jgi:hypothetical protein
MMGSVYLGFTLSPEVHKDAWVVGYHEGPRDHRCLQLLAWQKRGSKGRPVAIPRQRLPNSPAYVDRPIARSSLWTLGLGGTNGVLEGVGKLLLCRPGVGQRDRHPEARGARRAERGGGSVAD